MVIAAREIGTTSVTPLRPAEERRPQLCEELTQRELDLLAYLPTRLSNLEIAHRLYVSVNTVKSHLKNIYRKLEVTSRDRAVERTIELGLLPTGVQRCTCGASWLVGPISHARRYPPAQGT